MSQRWEWVTRLVRAVTNDDGSAVWSGRLTPEAWQVIRLAGLEARELDHGCIAEEHVLLGLLRHRASRAAALLEARGLDLPTARAELLRVGPTLRSGSDPAGALGALGIDVEEVRGRLEATFGTHAVQAAERRVRRRPWWRGGHRRPSPLCGYVLAKRSLELAAGFATRRGETGIGPDHLLYGVLAAARDPLGTQLGRRSRRQLAALGFTPGRPNPVRLQLQARGIDLAQLAAELSTSP